MEKKNDYVNPQVRSDYANMTLLDYFAGQALAGILSNGDTASILAQDMQGQYANGKSLAAGMAYRIADAMIAEKEAWAERQREVRRG